MHRIVLRLTAALGGAIMLAGCTSGLGEKPEAGPAVVPSFSLDGVYKFVEDGTGTRNGAPVTDLFKGETQWAFRTTCDADGCVATGGTFDPANPTAPAGGVRVADYVDGKWSLVTVSENAPCPRGDGQTFNSDQWSTWDIAGAPDKLTASITVAGVDECNFINVYAPVMTRVGDLPPGFKLPDPKDAPKRTPAPPATGFRGKYTVDFKRADTGQSQDTEHMDVKTTCLRSEDRCVATTVNIDPRDPGKPYTLQVYEYTRDKFRFQQTLGLKPCEGNKQGVGSKMVNLSLPPDPVPDPVPLVTGTLTLSMTGDCQGTIGYDVSFDRTGD